MVRGEYKEDWGHLPETQREQEGKAWKVNYFFTFKFYKKVHTPSFILWPGDKREVDLLPNWSVGVGPYLSLLSQAPTEDRTEVHHGGGGQYSSLPNTLNNSLRTMKRGRTGTSTRHPSDGRHEAKPILHLISTTQGEGGEGRNLRSSTCSHMKPFHRRN